MPGPDEMPSHHRPTAPLQGLTVLDLGTMVAVPYACLMLAELGARVIKVEPPTGDPMRTDPPLHNGVSAHFWSINRGKESVVLDLKSEEGRTRFLALVAAADVVAENWRHGVAERLGLDGGRLRAVNPRLVTASVRGFGDEGPYASQRAYDPIVQAVSSMAWSQGDADRPELVKTTLCDKLASLALSQGVLAALIRRGVTGVGSSVRVSMLDVAVSFLWPDLMRNETFAALATGEETVPEARGALVARGSDGKWLICTALTAEQWSALCAAVQRDEWVSEFGSISSRRTHHRFLSDHLFDRVPDWTRDEAVQELRGADVPCAPVLTARELLADSHVQEAGIVRERSHELLGAIREPAPLVRLDGGEAEASLTPAPALGEHGADIFAEFQPRGAADKAYV